MNTTHTPGPWDVVNGTIVARLQYRGDDAAICDVRTGGDDARLIAAAPDLLFALKEATRHLDRYTDCLKEPIEAFNKLIARAEGKQ